MAHHAWVVKTSDHLYAPLALHLVAPPASQLLPAPSAADLFHRADGARRKGERAFSLAVDSAARESSGVTSNDLRGLQSRPLSSAGNSARGLLGEDPTRRPT